MFRYYNPQTFFLQGEKMEILQKMLDRVDGNSPQLACNNGNLSDI
jgi:hypothetical protein